jgi:hypothetical protein
MAKKNSTKPATTTTKPAGKGKKAPEPTNNRGTPAVGPVAKATTTRKGGVEVRVEPTANGNRYTVAGVGLCPLLRWCGHHGYTPAQAKAMLKGLGLGEVVSASTVGCQVGSARAEAAGKKAHHPGKVPMLGKAEAAALKKLLEA